ncbi:purine-binding chemotaxis protein CheW [Paenibacillus phyllosphaerae]|uniref:Purine-binding chemotaxis protein CheW n=1 Tax=Paenibacillus phyllosphaerae TaxID=274593 RepID=A0A7W5B2Z1_9BACL|nr:purine-binding chemotaxis protein CheW [Paenibacillus phyllosphaerae]
METEQELQYVVIALGQERYGIHISEVYEIIKMQAITAVPKSQPFLEGVTNLRGKILPVINLRRRFKMEPADNSKHTRIVVAKYKDELVGIVVDAVEQVTTFTEIQPTSDTSSAVDRHFMQGIGLVQEEITCVLNIEQVLAG